MPHALSYLLGFLLLFAVSAESFGQVPPRPDRIRETARKILSRPEFRLFPRLEPGRSARGMSEVRSGGQARMRSSRTFPPIPGGGQFVGPGEERWANNGQPGGNNRRLENAPDGGRPGENLPQNPEEALGREDVFPEAGKLDGLRENQMLDEDGEPRPKFDEPDNNQEADNNPQNNNDPRPENNAANPRPKPAEPPRMENLPPARREKPPEEIRPRARNERWQGGNKALPAPRPRERTKEQAIPFEVPRARVGALARFVGAMFHFVAWTILTVICGLIVWLIIKAIREYERPYAFASIRGDGTSLLDLEPAQAPGDLPADVYVSQAQKLAEEGRYREAVVQLVLGAMSRAERAGWVRFRRGMTVRDYLRGIHEHPAAYQGFRSMIRIFEPLTFGRREPKQEHFEQSIKGYEAGFGLD